MTARRKGRALSWALAGLAGAVAPLWASQVKIFETQSQAGFLAGTLEGVSVDSLGRMELAPRAERLASPPEPFLLSAAIHRDGWVLGTGNAGKVLLLRKNGEIEELFAAPEPEVFAVWADPDGTIFAGTSPRGKVYRIPRGGTAETFFDPQAVYIWALDRARDGSLLVATGTEGKLFKVDADGQGTVFFDADDTHLRSLAVDFGGDVLVGTAGEGLILRLGKAGEVRTLHDAEEPEVASLAVGPDGAVYAAVVASEASLVDLSRGGLPGQPGQPGQAPAAGQPAPPQPQPPPAGEGEQTQQPAIAGTRREGATGPRSQALRIAPSGVVESLWSFADDTVFDLLVHGGRLWVGTGLEGKLYSYANGQMLLEKDLDERQIVALLPGEPGPALATTNAAAFYRITAGRESKGTYTSAVLDAGQVARFGTFHWRGRVPAKGAARFSFRTGVSAEPDRTWGPWTPPREGREVSLSGVPPGRYVQWRAELAAGGAESPLLYGIELSYRQENLAPKIESLTTLDPGQILVPANFNPTNQVYEPAHPNREGIFTTLTPAAGDEPGRSKPLWKRGFQTLRWKASDPNQDELLYSLAFKPAGEDGALSSGDWLPVSDEIKEDYLSFDATGLPDGVYRFRLQASDAPSNEPDTALVGERVSDPVVVDHTPPVLVEAKAGREGIRAVVRDAASPLREAVVSVDAGEWQPVVAEDGLIDGREETLLVTAAVQPGTRLVLLRVTDAAHNVVTFDLSGKR